MEIQQGALSLPEDQRASLVAALMNSLPMVLADVDDGSMEAKRRLAELKRDPSAGRTWDQIKSELMGVIAHGFTKICEVPRIWRRSRPQRSQIRQNPFLLYQHPAGYRRINSSGVIGCGL